MKLRGGKWHMCVTGKGARGWHHECETCIVAGPVAWPWYVEGEEWRPVPTFPRYLASSHGRIKHLSPSRRPVKPANATNGYVFVTAVDMNGRQRQPKVHVLVAEAFLGPRPEGHVINHIDLDKTNNAPANLEYVTQMQNVEHAKAHGRHNANRKKWKESDLQRVRAAVAAGHKREHVHKALGVTTYCVHIALDAERSDK